MATSDLNQIRIIYENLDSEKPIYKIIGNHFYIREDIAKLFMQFKIFKNDHGAWLYKPGLDWEELSSDCELQIKTTVDKNNKYMLGYLRVFVFDFGPTDKTGEEYNVWIGKWFTKIIEFLYNDRLIPLVKSLENKHDLPIDI